MSEEICRKRVAQVKTRHRKDTINLSHLTSFRHSKSPYCRKDTKDRVALHRRRMAERHCAERLHVKVVMTADERDESGHLFTFDVSGQHLTHSFEPRL